MIALGDDAKKAMLIAHPDDETLWASGLLMRQRSHHWTVICASTPRKDPLRVWKFQQVCEELGVHFVIYPKVESITTEFDHLDDIVLSGYDLVLTHNSIGEYGHVHHIACHNHVLKNFPGQKYFFGYGLPRDNADYMVYLDDEEYRAKVDLIKCYNHPNGEGGRPLWQYLLNDFDGRFDLRREYFVV